MSNYNDLKTAVFTAFAYHDGQKRQDGTDYIYHPLSVMMQLQHEDLTTQVVAVLHDILEDTSFTLTMMRRLFGIEVATTVFTLSRLDDEESYEDHILGIKNSNNDRAIKVKMADLCHNLSTIDKIRDDTKRIKLKTRYENAIKVLSSNEV